MKKTLVFLAAMSALDTTMAQDTRVQLVPKNSQSLRSEPYVFSSSKVIYPQTQPSPGNSKKLNQPGIQNPVKSSSVSSDQLIANYISYASNVASNPQEKKQSIVKQVLNLAQPNYQPQNSNFSNSNKFQTQQSRPNSQAVSQSVTQATALNSGLSNQKNSQSPGNVPPNYKAPASNNFSGSTSTSTINPPQTTQVQREDNNLLNQVPTSNQQQKIVQRPVQNPSSAILDSHSGKCFQTEYKFQGGDIQISIDYRVISQSVPQESAVHVNFDGKLIFKLLPSYSGKNVKIEGQATKGTHIIEFCPVGSPNETNHQVQLSNVIVSQKTCIGNWGRDLITNGDFENNRCSSNNCIWNQQTVQNNIAAWISSPEIEVGKKGFYNTTLGSGWVAELDANVNTCIKQKVALKSGKYSLRFDWAGSQGTSNQSNQFEVRLHGKALFASKATNQNVHQENIEFEFSDVSAQSEIEFCGTGNSDGYGVLIDNVKLLSYDKCATSKFVKL